MRPDIRIIFKSLKPRDVLRIVIVVAVIILLLPNLMVIAVARPSINATATTTDAVITKDEIADIKFYKPDCIMVLGAGVKPDGSPTSMLADRLEVGYYLYSQDVAPKILLSGDNGQVEYNEVKAMKDYMLAKGVPEKDIFLDHAGFSTYDSMYRAKAVFCVDSPVIVTQRYHLYRALYIGQSFKLGVYGVASDQRQYAGQLNRDVREHMARTKDFFKCVFKPNPKFLGDQIPIKGDGRKSWGE